MTSKFFSIQTLFPFLSLALSLFPPGLADYVWVSLELVCFEFGALFVFDSPISSPANTLTDHGVFAHVWP